MATRRSTLARLIGRRIVQLRGEVGMTQEQLAWAADLQSKGYLSRIESGQRLPSLDVIARLAQRIGVEPRDPLVSPDQDPVARAMDELRRGHVDTKKRTSAEADHKATRTGPSFGLRAAEPSKRRRVRSKR